MRRRPKGWWQIGTPGIRRLVISGHRGDRGALSQPPTNLHRVALGRSDVVYIRSVADTVEVSNSVLDPASVKQN
jgi:hypothetical protein